MSRRARGGRVRWRNDRDPGVNGWTYVSVAYHGEEDLGVVVSHRGRWLAECHSRSGKPVEFSHRYQAKRWVECELARAECLARQPSAFAGYSRVAVPCSTNGWTVSGTRPGPAVTFRPSQGETIETTWVGHLASALTPSQDIKASFNLYKGPVNEFGFPLEDQGWEG